MRIVTEVIREISELGDRTSPADFPEAMLVTPNELREILEGRLSEILEHLVVIASSAHEALEDSEEMEGPDGRQHVISSSNFDILSDALDFLDELPDNKPGYTMCGPGRASWLLFGAEPPAVRNVA